MFKIGHFTKYLTAPGLLGPVSIKALLVKIQISVPVSVRAEC